MGEKRERYRNRIEILQGTLDLLILQTLQWGPQHGYGISVAIRNRSGELLQVDTGSLYPALHRLERAGLVRASWAESGGRRRRVYELTPAGRRALDGERSTWRDFSAAVTALLQPAPPPAVSPS